MADRMRGMTKEELKEAMIQRLAVQAAAKTLKEKYPDSRITINKKHLATLPSNRGE